jgi:hypothetical protein
MRIIRSTVTDIIILSQSILDFSSGQKSKQGNRT